MSDRLHDTYKITVWELLAKQKEDELYEGVIKKFRTPQQQRQFHRRIIFQKVTWAKKLLKIKQEKLISQREIILNTVVASNSREDESDLLADYTSQYVRIQCHISRLEEDIYIYRSEYKKIIKKHVREWAIDQAITITRLFL